MTRKDYVKFAAMLAGELALAKSRCGILAVADCLRVKGIILSIADLFAQDNSRFDRERFYVACGLNADGSL